MSVLDTMHGRWVHGRRVRVLSRHLAEVIPQGARVVDIGCGDGKIGSLIAAARSDVAVSGFEIATRPGAHIPVREFDGRHIPLETRGADVVMLCDVLHHDEEPMRLLSEAARVANRCIVLKDVALVGRLSGLTLRVMDWIGNARHSVPLPYAFWSQPRWEQAFNALGLHAEERRTRLGLYPPPANLAFERHMHFIVRLVRSG